MALRPMYSVMAGCIHTRLHTLLNKCYEEIETLTGYQFIECKSDLTQ